MSLPTKPKRINKFLYGWKFFLNYGEGWEYECFELTRKEMQENRKAYRENCNFPLRIRRGREPNPDWQPPVTGGAA